MRLDGFGLLVNDMGTMIRFYRDVLCFKIKESEQTSNVYLGKSFNQRFPSERRNIVFALWKKRF